LWAIPRANPELNFAGKTLWICIHDRDSAFVAATFDPFMARCEQIALKKIAITHTCVE